jgi:uncharacterized protein
MAKIPDRNNQKMKYKLSNYNFFFERKNKDYLAFNAISGALIRIKRQDYENLQTITSGKIVKNKVLFNTLLRGRFLINEKIDEIKILKIRNLISRFRTDKLGLVVIITLNCNFRCVYCYEKKKNVVMKPEIMNSLLELIQKAAPKKRRIRIVWFGGEPLLCFDQISFLSEKIKQICKNANCEYKSVLVTNGFLLSEEISHRLPKLGIGTIQITLDGPPEIHNKRRPLVGGGDTFNKIIENLKKVPPEVEILIKINIDKKNFDKSSKVLDYLEILKNRKNLYISFNMVDPSSPICASYIYQSFTEKEFAKIEINLSQVAIKRGVKLLRRLVTLNQALCHAVEYNNFIIDPEGRLFKCYLESSNQSNAVGFLDKNGDIKITNRPKLLKWISWDVTEDPKCKECKILPICMGGCKYRRERKVLEEGEGCTFWKYNLKEACDFFYQWKKQLD